MKSNLSLFLLVTFLFTAIYLVNAKYVGSKDTIPAQLLPVSIIQEGNLDFNEFATKNDKEKYWYQSINGQYYSSYSPFPGIFNLPVFFVASLFDYNIAKKNKKLSLISAALMTALTLGFSFLIALKFLTNSKQAFLVTLIYGLGTSYFSVTSRGIWEHTPAILCLTIALYLILCTQKIAWSGLFLGLAVLARPVTFIFAIIFGIYVLIHQRKHALLFCCLAFLTAAVFFAYNYFYLGSALAPFHSNSRNISLFNLPNLEAFFGILISPNRGLLIFSPFLLLAFYALVRQYKKDLFYAYLAVASIVFLIFISSWSNWWGGHSYSYRLLIDLLPILFVFTLLYYKEYKPLLLYLLALPAFYFQFLGAYYYPCGFNLKEKIDTDPNALWKVKNGEILRCTKELVRSLSSN